jgi:hypothetical protein
MGLSQGLEMYKVHLRLMDTDNDQDNRQENNTLKLQYQKSLGFGR